MTPRIAPMRFASAFTGIGGFEVAWRDLGIEVPTMIEIDKACQKVLARHFTNTDIKGDICDVKGTDIKGGIDGFVGGFPCQDTSIAAPHRLGLEGERSQHYFSFVRLLAEYQRLIDDLNPRWVVIENPVGLLTSPGNRGGVDRTGWDMAAVVRGLEDLGYGWAYRVVDGRYLGTTQKRERVIVVGHRGGDPRPAWEVLGDGGAGTRPAPARTLGGRKGGPAAAVRPGVGDDTLIWRKSARARAAIDKGGYETWVPAEHANTLAGFDGGLATRQTHLIQQGGRLRTLTLTEWERLQGFPDGWTDNLKDSDRYRLLGNAMHVGMARWLGDNLLRVHQALPQVVPA